MSGWEGPWKKCEGMNKDGKCRAGKNHLLHKKHWLGGWYAQVPMRKSDRDALPGQKVPPNFQRGKKLSAQKPKKKWYQ